LENKKQKAKGLLPAVSWLTRNRYMGLCTCMRNHSALFTHIEQKKMYKFLEEWVKFAEELAMEHDGVLPNSNWLLVKGYGGLRGCMHNHPELFAHIEQDKKFKSSEEWVKIAEGLAKENGGELQYRAWLSRNGYGGLDSCMREYPELFKHIKQKKLLKSPEEWVKIAEGLAKENGGEIQRRSWLNNNKYTGLDRCMSKNPELFKHIKQDKKSKSPEEYVVIAEKLVQENNGVLPDCKWLRNNRHMGVYQCMQNHPDRFKHIKQNKLIKTLEEWVKIAEELAKDNGGILQHYKWLKRNGCGGLNDCMKNHPELFKGIKQEFYIKNKKSFRIIGEDLK
jgi:hypothetical protein